MLVFLLNCTSYGTWFSANLHCELQRYNQHLLQNGTGQLGREEPDLPLF